MLQNRKKKHLQHFATKLSNFANCKTFFSAVMKDFVHFASSRFNPSWEFFIVLYRFIISLLKKERANN